MPTCRPLLLLLAIFALAALFACPMGASEESIRARKITSDPEYKGYRVERSPKRPVTRNTREGGRDGRPSNSGSSDGGSNGAGDGTSDGRQPSDTSGDGSTGDGRPNDGRSSDGRSGDGERYEPPRRETTVRGEPRPTPQSGSSGSGPSSGSVDPGFLQAVFWVIIIALILFVAVFIIRALLDRKPRKKAKKAKAKTKAEDKAEEEAPIGPVQNFPELEAELAAALRAGDYAQAALLRYKLFWLTAGWRGAVDESEVKTWRDALRLVRAEELRREMRRLLFLVESVRYGRHKPRAEEFKEWQSKLEGIDPKAVLA